MRGSLGGRQIIVVVAVVGRGIMINPSFAPTSTRCLLDSGRTVGQSIPYPYRTRVNKHETFLSRVPPCLSIHSIHSIRYFVGGYCTRSFEVSKPTTRFRDCRLLSCALSSVVLPWLHPHCCCYCRSTVMAVPSCANRNLITSTTALDEEPPLRLEQAIHCCHPLDTAVTGIVMPSDKDTRMA